MSEESTANSNITYRLTPFDSFCFGVMITFGYVLSKENNSKFPSESLLAAVHRAADKWRLLASRIVENPDNGDYVGVYYMKVPTGSLPPSYPTVNFSESEYPDTAYEHTPIPTSFSTSNSSYIIPRPDPQYFRTPSLPGHVSVLAQDNSPIWFIHISHFSNATCLGFSIPHGIFDGKGMGMIINAINAEFSGREWIVPSLASIPGHGVTIFEEAISSLSYLPLPSSRNESKTGFDFEPWKRELPPISMWSVMRFKLYMAYETLVQKQEARLLYLSERAIKAIIEPVKAQIKERGEGSWVSTGDILVAWFVKSSLSKEPYKLGRISINTTMSFRDPLSALTDNLSLKGYPHNTVVPCPIALMPGRTLSTTSITALALLHRSRIEELRTPSSIESIASFVGPPVSNPNFLVNRAIGTTSYTFSNQVVGNFTFPTFGGGDEEEKVLGFCEWFSPFDFDHIAWINKYGTGYQIICKLRDYRWRAVIDAVKALEEGASGSLVHA